MTDTHMILPQLLSRLLGPDQASTMLRLLKIHPDVISATGSQVPRAVMAQALNILLFADLLERVPAAQAYAMDRLGAGETILHDHGALRTIAMQGMGALPAGEEALTRILRPLGYAQNGVYPLDALKMTGRAYAHVDYPEEVPQFFVSELYPERLSPAFQAAMRRVTAHSLDPIDTHTQKTLNSLAAGNIITIDAAATALPVLASCFARQHDTPYLTDYEILRAESAEAAWIATEGNAFNHATDRVTDVAATAKAERALGRPMKDVIEVSKSGRIRQTAYRAASVQRAFRLGNGSVIERTVPGSFYEFITRLNVADDAGQPRLDLGFDSANAQGIFKMTAGAAA